MQMPLISGYTTIRPIFVGGMTDIYVARAAAGPRVVLRFLKEVYARQRAVRKRFLQSAKIMAQIDHPHIVRLIDAAVQDGIPYMVLDYIEARSLRTHLNQRSAWTSGERKALLLQLAEALDYLHRLGYWHLDLKPENILVTSDDQVHLIDFDSCVPRANKPVRVHTHPGTPAYAPPEWVHDRRVDERADIFSFGVVAYEWFTGHKPFERDTRDASLIAQCAPDVLPTPVTAYTAEVPVRLQSLIAKCLAKHPDARYPSMSLVRKDLNV